MAGPETPSQPANAAGASSSAAPQLIAKPRHSAVYMEHDRINAQNQMESEIKKLIDLAPADKRKSFEAEMKAFLSLYSRYLLDKVKKTQVEWEKIKAPAFGQIHPYAELQGCPIQQEPALLKKLAVLKLNGGLGTTMGCVGPKSVIEVRESKTFLDLTVEQIIYLQDAYTQHGVEIPLVLMNSFNTDEETKRIIQKYPDINIVTFNQSRYPRIGKDSGLPCPKNFDWESDKEAWYPPGHGDLYQALNNSGVLDKLIAQGKEYIFVSNVDNLGATVDTKILKHMIDKNSEFIMEVTNKTRSDVKGGTLIDYEGTVRLLEIAQVSKDHIDDFKSIKKFQIFNTNNLWISTKAIKRLIEQQKLELEIIVNMKTKDSKPVIQLETAAGAAIRYFGNAHGINVPRSRFLPVKSTDDLFLVQSDLYQMTRGCLEMNPKRHDSSVPLVKLGDEFKKVQPFLTRFKGPPHILDLDHLTVAGDVAFGKDVHLKGTVIIIANPDSRIEIPSGAILENTIVSGNLRMLDH